MKYKLNIILLLLVIFCLGVSSSFAAVPINAASCSLADVQTAVDAANTGDTVLVPMGEAVWDSPLIITKGIILKGAGKTNTIIKSNVSSYSSSPSNCLIYFNADETTAVNDDPFKVEGFCLKAEGLYPPYALLYLENTQYSNHLTQVVISNNKFVQLKNSGYSCVSIIFNTAVFGVVYHNKIIDGSHAWRYFGNLPTGKNVIYWEPGSPYAMYFEDNFISISEAWDTSLIISGGQGNRYVSRYNTFDLSANGPNYFMQTHDIHGNQTNNPGAGIGFEVYGEHRLGGSGRWLDQRGGRVHFFMNKWSETNGVGSYNIWEEYDDDTYCSTSCEGLNYPTTAGGVNCLQRTYGSYYWKNFTGTDGTVLVTATNILYDHFNRFTSVLNDPLTIMENQNWWRDNTGDFTGQIDSVGSCGYYEGPSCTKSGIGCGTYEEMQAITNAADGVGFWVTDQENCNDISDYVGYEHTKNIEGTLYKYDASHGWLAAYTPYAYPHPLRLEDGAPQTPTGLKLLK